MHPSEGFWLFKGSNRHNSSINQYGGPFGNEHHQTCIPSCMNRIHPNYSWSSKAVQGSAVCNRSSACIVQNRAASSIAKVDRTGRLISCGASAMELAVMLRGGRVPDCVLTPSTAGTVTTGYPTSAAAAAAAGGNDNSSHAKRPLLLPVVEPIHQDMADEAAALVGRNNIISATYIASHNFKVHQQRMVAMGSSSVSGGYRNHPAAVGGGSNASGSSRMGGMMQCGSVLQGSMMMMSDTYSSGSTDARYTFMDKEYMRCMHSQMGWDRDNGIIHLMPIAVVYQEEVG
jgi:hypothetical protein